jgi:hypothetical protein
MRALPEILYFNFNINLFKLVLITTIYTDTFFITFTAIFITLTVIFRTANFTAFT